MSDMPLGSAVLIVNDSKILCVRRGKSDKWGLPGGKLELNESTLDAAVRECAEETGLTLDSSCGQFIYGGECNADHLSLKQFWVDVYLFKLPVSQHARTIESDNIVAWLTPEELLAKSSFPVFHQKLLSVITKEVGLSVQHPLYGIAPDYDR